MSIRHLLAVLSICAGYNKLPTRPKAREVAPSKCLARVANVAALELARGFGFANTAVPAGCASDDLINRILLGAAFCVSMNGLDPFGQTETLKNEDVQVGWIELPPLVPVRGRDWMSVVIVVPAFSAGQQCDQPVVGAAVASLVVTVAPDMRHGIDRERGVPREQRAHDHAPYEPTQ